MNQDKQNQKGMKMSRYEISSQVSGLAAEGLESLASASPAAGDILWRKRNVVWRMPGSDHGEWVVKRFGRRFPGPIVYAIRAGKAKRSYRYAMEMRRRGVATPEPVAYAEWRGPLHTLRSSVYISRYVPTDAWEDVLAVSLGEARRRLWNGLARFMAAMHDAGFIHNDANVTNIRVAYPTPDGDPQFSLIDLNRMKVFPEGTSPTPAERFSDLTRFCEIDDEFMAFAGDYLQASGYGPEMMPELLKQKHRIDRHIHGKARRKARIRAFKKKLGLIKQ